MSKNERADGPREASMREPTKWASHAMHIASREPLGWREGQTFHGPGRIPIYRPEDVAAGKAVRDARVAHDLSLSGLAKLLGMKAVDLSAVECGAAVWRDPGAADFELRRVLSMLRGTGCRG